MAILFLPGTFIHELSHYIFARILFVRAAKLNLMPSIEGSAVELGSVEIEKVDILRRMAIGTAPFIVGTFLIISILFFEIEKDIATNKLEFLIVAYILFVIGNTMFSSEKDMEGALELFFTLAIIGIFAYIIGFQIPQISNVVFHEEIIRLFKLGSYLLVMPLILDILVIISTKILNSLFNPS